MNKILIGAGVALVIGIFVYYLLPGDGSSFEEICEGYGPQTPRDITKKEGSNPVSFKVAPDHSKMNICNIHFHKNAEHSGPEFNTFVGTGEFDGYKCNQTSGLTAAELKAPEVKGCTNIQPGDTIEIHWVHSSCNIQPGEGLGSCLADDCKEPDLRVQTQVFVLVNDANAAQMQDYSLRPKTDADAYFQAKKIPATDAAVQFLGSTTGPSFDAQTKCSPLKVNWSVEPTCKKMDINSVHKWCQGNVFKENSAHGIRALVTNKKLLSEIQ